MFQNEMEMGFHVLDSGFHWQIPDDSDDVETLDVLDARDREFRRHQMRRHGRKRRCA